MGLLTILKKMKHKEREMRLLMLYPFTELHSNVFIDTFENNNYF